MNPDTPSSAASGMGDDALLRALIEELRPYASRPLGSIRIDTDDIRKIVDGFDALSAKDRELAALDDELAGERWHADEAARQRDVWKDRATTAERARDEALSALRTNKAALDLVRVIVVEAAMTGFNCHYGDWAERLYASQADTHAAVTKADAVLTTVSREQRGEEA